MDIPIKFAEFTALNLIGKSHAFTNVLKAVQQIAPYDVPVSIYGETGTGKELIARAIHYLSSRASNPFIPINCGSLPDALFENEMFGHVRGAFTDAKNTKAGLIAQANGGVLFLDEIEDLSLEAQASLLRFMQDKQYRLLGDVALKSADVRIIVASNVELKHLCDSGVFRKDLYYRLNVMPLALPPLRMRDDDITLLSEHLLHNLHIRYECSNKILHPSVLEWLKQQDWPGNIRELENTIHRAFLLTEDTTIQLEHILADSINQTNSRNKIETSKNLPFNKAKSLAVSDFERSYLDSLMRQNNGNVTRAAIQAGKERRALGKLLKKYDLQPQAYKHQISSF